MKMTNTFLLAGAALTMLSGSAIAADLFTPPAASVVAPAATDWAGPYVGASVGYGWATANDAVDSTGVDGFSVGGQAGYNFDLTDTVVAGIEGDLNYNDQQGSFTGARAPNSYRINWDGSIRGRVGIDIDGILPYAEAGVAFANADLATPASSNNTYTGYTVGGGVEFKVADPVSLNAEYRYSDYGDQTYGADSVHLNDSTTKVGLNYHF